jgi:Flp pilus assembly pilin Flp
MAESYLKINSKKGQGLVEWGITVLLISVVVMSTLFAFAPQMKGILQKIETNLNTTTP